MTRDPGLSDRPPADAGGLEPAAADPVSTHLQALREELHKLRQERAARDMNSIVRASNSALVTKNNQPLEALCSIITGGVIPNFPRTLGEIMELKDQETDEILHHLGLKMNDTPLAEKRRRIKCMCGLFNV